MEPAMKYTGKRVDEFAAAKRINKRTKVGKAAYNEIVVRLNKAEQKYQRQSEARKRKGEEEKQRVRKEKEFLEEQERLLLETIREREGKKIRSNEVYRRECNNETTTENLLEAARAIMGLSQVRVVFVSDDGVVSRDAVIEITTRYTDPDSVYWHDIFPHIRKGSDEFIWEDHPGTLVLTRELSEAVKPARLVQKFRDGMRHCVLDPLIDQYVAMREDAENRSQKYKAGLVIKALEAMKETYRDGVPEGEPMEELAKVIKRKIEITDTFGNAYVEYNKGSSRAIQFSNTRENHVELGHLSYQGKATIVESLKEILVDCQRRYIVDKEFYSFREKNGEVMEVRSIRGAWRLKNDLYEVYETFNAEIGLRDYGFDALKDDELFQFVRQACTVDSAPVKVSKVVPDTMIDMKQAYTKFKMSRYYKGFLGKIQSWWNLTGFDCSFIRKHIGIYQVRVSRVCKVLRLLGLSDGVYIRSSVEIEQWMDLGVCVELLSGCTGSSFDFEFSDEMRKERIVDGVKMRPYKWWSGCLGRKSYDTVYKFSGSYEWCGHLKSLGHNVFYEGGTIVAHLPKKRVMVHHHVLAFITGYLRTNIIDAMMAIGVDRISHVVTDGIYLKGEASVPGFVPKKMINHTNFSHGWYKQSIGCFAFETLKDERLLSNCMLCGAGGTGKTDSVLRLIGKAYRDVLYVVPQHLLGAEKREKYGVRYTTIHTLIGVESVNKETGKVVGCRAWKETRGEPAVLVIDEGTMIDSEWIRRAIRMYKNSLLYVCGDFVELGDRVVSFQCRSGKPGIFNKVFSGLPIIMFENDWRSKDGRIREFKKMMRAKMRSLYTDGEAIDAMALAGWLKGKVDVVPFDVAMTMEPGIWIAGTHATNKRLMEKGVVSGYITRNREKIYEMREDVVETRGSFTTHSFQGSTIEDKTVYICIGDSFELAMIYTAVSRAVRMEQLVFVA